MRLYLDTSLVVSALSNEPRSAEILTWIRGHGADELLISDWTVTEVSAAFAMKTRAGIFTKAMQMAALDTFMRMQRQVFRKAGFQSRFFQLAADMTRLPETALRAGDALHLAISQEQADRLCTLDKMQANAGRSVGIDTLLV